MTEQRVTNLEIRVAVLETSLSTLLDSIKRLEALTESLTTAVTDLVAFMNRSKGKLAGNFNATADDMITLLCDGTNWYEQARSAN